MADIIKESVVITNRSNLHLGDCNDYIFLFVAINGYYNYELITNKKDLSKHIIDLLIYKSRRCVIDTTICNN